MIPNFIEWLARKLGRRPSPWKIVILLYTRRTAEGLPICGPAMRRRGTSGAWEYRFMTEAENAEYFESDAW